MFPNRLITDFLAYQGKKEAERPALVCGQDSLTYGQLLTETERIAFILVDKVNKLNQSQPKGTFVALALTNPFHQILVFLSALRAGLIPFFLDAGEREETKEYFCKLAGCNLIVDDNMWRMVSLSKQSRHAVCLPSLSDKDLFSLFLSSGSTGRPKMIMRNHQSWVATFADVILAFGLQEAEKVLIPGSLNYSASLHICILTLFLGGTAYLQQSVAPKKTLEIIEEEKITACFMVPALYRALCKEAGKSNKKIVTHATFVSDLRVLITAGAKMDYHTAKVLGSLFGHGKLYEYYGASELGHVSLLTPGDWETKAGTVGRIFPGVKVSITDELGNPLPHGETGYISVKSQAVCQGYWQINENRLWRGSWASVNDLGYFDEDGYLVLVGRANNMINRSGVKIVPEIVEEALRKCPDIEDVLVRGEPDPLRGEAVIAYLVVKTGSDLQKMDLIRFSKENLSSRERPDRYLFVDFLPKTAKGEK